MLSFFRQERDGLPSKVEVKMVKVEVHALPITVVEPENGKKRSSQLARWSPASKRSKTSFIACGSSTIVEKLVIDMFSPKG